jgi:hypothetical protein
MTLNEIAYNIKNLAEGGYTTDDNKLSIRQVKEWIHYHRLNILESYTVNGKKAPTGSTQNIGVYSVPEEGEYLTVPRVASFGETRGISSVTSVDGNMIFARTTQDKIAFQEQSRFTSAMPKFFIEDATKLYFYGSGSGESVKIIAVLEDPTDAPNWGGDDSEYPVPAQLIKPLIEAVAQVELNITLKTPGDLINNEIEGDRETQSSGK